MAVARLEKYLIVTHKSEETQVLKFLQKKELVELRPYFKTNTDTEGTPSPVQKHDLTVPDVNIKAKRALDILEEYEKKSAEKWLQKPGR